MTTKDIVNSALDAAEQFVDRDATIIGPTLQLTFASHSEAMRKIVELRRLLAAVRAGKKT